MTRKKGLTQEEFENIWISLGYFIKSPEWQLQINTSSDMSYKSFMSKVDEEIKRKYDKK